CAGPDALRGHQRDSAAGDRPRGAQGRRGVGSRAAPKTLPGNNDSMIIVMKEDVGGRSAEVDRIVEVAGRFPQIKTEVRVIEGATRSLTEIYLLGPTASVPKEAF